MADDGQKQAAIKLAQHILADTNNTHFLRTSEYKAILEALGCDKIEPRQLKPFVAAPNIDSSYYTHRGLITEGKEKPPCAELPKRISVASRERIASVKALLQAMKDAGLLKTEEKKIDLPASEPWAAKTQNTGQNEASGRARGGPDLQAIVDGWE